MLRIFRLGLFSLAVTAIVFLFYAPAASAAAPPAAPTISSISPASGILAQTVNVILQGTNFVQGNTAVNVSGTGVTSSAVQVVTDTFLFVTLTIAPTTTTGPRDVTVTTSGGTSNASVFTVNDTTLPTITSITPPNGNRGQTVNITVTGTNFVSNATFINVGGNGIGVTAVNVSSVTSLTATLLISTGASTGNRGVSVTTAGGTSSLANFSVLGAPTLTGGCYNLMAGSAVNCTLSGTNFVHGATTVSVS
jgi:hypothetical protein